MARAYLDSPPVGLLNAVVGRVLQAQVDHAAEVEAAPIVVGRTR
jgi:hypothetical protein